MTGREFFEKHNGIIIKRTHHAYKEYVEWVIVGYCDAGDFNRCIVVQLLSDNLNELRSLYDIVRDGGRVISGAPTEKHCCYAFMSQDTILELIENAKQAEMLPKYSRHRHKFSPIKFR